MKRGHVEDTLVAIYFHNEEGQHTGYLVCERSKLTDENMAHVKALRFSSSPSVRDNALDRLLADNVLDIAMIYREEARAGKLFCYAQSLEDPDLNISCLIVSFS